MLYVVFRVLFAGLRDGDTKGLPKGLPKGLNDDGDRRIGDSLLGIGLGLGDDALGDARRPGGGTGCQGCHVKTGLVPDRRPGDAALGGDLVLFRVLL